jgi:hypothetical protein
MAAVTSTYKNLSHSVPMRPGRVIGVPPNATTPFFVVLKDIRNRQTVKDRRVFEGKRKVGMKLDRGIHNVDDVDNGGTEEGVMVKEGVIVMTETAAVGTSERSFAFHEHTHWTSKYDRNGLRKKNKAETLPIFYFRTSTVWPSMYLRSAVHTQGTFALNQEILGPRCQVEVKGAHAGRTGLTITDVSIDDLANCQTRYHSTFTTSTPSNSVSIHTSCSVSECDEREGSTRKTHPRRPRASDLGPGFLASSKSPRVKGAKGLEVGAVINPSTSSTSPPSSQPSTTLQPITRNRTRYTKTTSSLYYYYTQRG